MAKNNPPNKKKYIATPDEMWELFMQYKESVKNRPKLVQDYVGKDGKVVYREREVPLTFEGFDNFVFTCEGVRSKGVQQYFTNQDKLYNTYIGICSRIKAIIRQDQIEGGMVSIYNPSITQRLNGLTEKVEQTNIEKPIFGGIDLDINHEMD
jgi:hypothetical protein